MHEFTEQEIDQVSREIDQQGLTYTLLKNEILDHICCGIEAEMENGLTFNKAYEKADLIVSAGGAGTTIESTRRGLKLVVIENETLMEGHQAQLIGELSNRGHLKWCRDITELATCIDAALKSTFPPFKTDSPKAHRMISKIIESS